MKTESQGRSKTAIQSATVIAFRSLIDRLVRDLVPPRRRHEGAQVARIGALVALEHFDATRGPSLSRLVVRHARAEIALWKAAQ